MSPHDPPEGATQWALAEEQARKQREFLREFPGGVAPYSRNNLIAFGLFGGIIGAGIAGVVNLRRTRQARFIPLLLLIGGLLLLTLWLMITLISERIAVSAIQVDSNILVVILALFNTLLGMIFAAVIGWRQNRLLQRWRALTGNRVPDWRVRGGCRGMFLLVLLGIATAILVQAIGNTVFLNPALQVLYPPQRYTVKGISVTAPAGWVQADPETAFMACSPSGLTCLAALRERISDSDAEFLIVPGTHPLLMINAVSAGIRRSYPSFPAVTPEPYTYPTLANRAAYSFDLPLTGRSLVVTTIEDSAVVIIFYLNCGSRTVLLCRTLRDQFVASLQYSAPPGTPDLQSMS